MGIVNNYAAEPAFPATDYLMPEVFAVQEASGMAVEDYEECWQAWVNEVPVASGEMREIAVARLLECLHHQQTTLDLQGLNLSNLPALPPQLEKLHADYNQLVTLPVLPKSLAYLNVNANKLVGLPEPLPEGLGTLKCQNNLLTWLPVSLRWLPDDAEVDIRDNPLSLRTLSGILKTLTAPDYRGPLIQFHLLPADAQQPVRQDEEPKASWLKRAHETLLLTVADGGYDGDLPSLIACGRELFRLEQLTHIFAGKIDRVRNVKQWNGFLAFQNLLRHELKLSSGLPVARSLTLPTGSPAELNEARKQVAQTENEDFAHWFALWEPWHNVLERTEPEAWLGMQQQQAAALEKYQALTQSELSDDERLDIQLHHLLPLTRQVLAARGMMELLGPRWDS